MRSDDLHDLVREYPELEKAYLKARGGKSLDEDPKQWGSRFTKTFLDKLAKKLREWIKDEDNIWITEFYNEHGIVNKRLPTFFARSKKFKLAYELAMETQERRLFMKAFNRQADPSMAKFGLQNRHGWAEKIETTQKNTGGGQITFNVFKQMQDSFEKAGKKLDLLDGIPDADYSPVKDGDE